MKNSNNLGNNILSDKCCKDQLTQKLRLTFFLQSRSGTVEDSVAVLTCLSSWRNIQILRSFPLVLEGKARIGRLESLRLGALT